MNIELHIERLILDGLQVESRHRGDLKAALEAELTHLLASAGVRSDLLSGGSVRSLGGGEIQVAHQTSAAHLGNQIAQAVHGGIGSERVSQRQGSPANAINRTPQG